MRKGESALCTGYMSLRSPAPKPTTEALYNKRGVEIQVVQMICTADTSTTLGFEDSWSRGPSTPSLAGRYMRD